MRRADRKGEAIPHIERRSRKQDVLHREDIHEQKEAQPQEFRAGTNGKAEPFRTSGGAAEVK
jgi:hypothetical protein